MFSPSPTTQTGKRAGFTLIELLVVITIIAVLASIFLPVMGAVQNRARKVQCVNDMRNVKVGIIAYYSDYRHYPAPVAAAGAGLSDTVYSDPTGNGQYTSADLFDILRAVDGGSLNQSNVLNPSLTVYWPGALATSSTKPRSGITTANVTSPTTGITIPQGSLVDPWGNPYIVWLDTSLDGDLTAAIAAIYTDAGTVTPGTPPMGVTFASLGADGKLGTKGNRHLTSSDDIASWQ